MLTSNFCYLNDIWDLTVVWFESRITALVSQITTVKEEDPYMEIACKTKLRSKMDAIDSFADQTMILQRCYSCVESI